MKKFSYIPNTEQDRARMLEFLGLRDVEELFQDIPEPVGYKGSLPLPPAWSEPEIYRNLGKLAVKNANLEDYVSFLGAGAYQHFIPAVVDAIISRSEFYTAYTPYQPEISQGLLQAIFEYQTVICELTGMDVSNASMYDGPSAMAEAGLMVCSATRRAKLLVSKAIHPEYRAVVATYAAGQDIEVLEIDLQETTTDLSQLKARLNEEIAGVFVSYPNFFGSIEDLREIADLTHEKGALLVVGVHPIALGLLEAPGALGADIVVGEGQTLGNPISFGGPYLGILAATQALVRRIPGRVVGQTADLDGRRAFVLTLQAREQHIRREKASSNICSNQALNALAATVYAIYMGKEGMRKVGELNLQKSHYAARKLSQLPGVSLVGSAPFFNEFVVKLPVPAEKVNSSLFELGIVGGYDFTPIYPQFGHAMLLAVTEVRTKDEIDTLVEGVKSAL